jgi:putative transcriptional regulator
MPFTPPSPDSPLAVALAIMERARREELERAPRPVDVFRLRRRLGMTQRVFAHRFGFPLATLRHWERGERKPSGASLMLLNVIKRNPLAVIRALGTREPY